MACARRLFCRAAALRCRTFFAATRSITLRDASSAAAAAVLSPAAIAFLTFLIAVRTAVRKLKLWLWRLSAWRARLRADLILAMALIGLRKGGEF